MLMGNAVVEIYNPHSEAEASIFEKQCDLAVAEVVQGYSIFHRGMFVNHVARDQIWVRKANHRSTRL